MLLTIGQIRAARALIGWSQANLAEASGLSFATIQRIERIGVERSQAANVEKIQAALEDAGVLFIAKNGNGPGVRLRDRE